MKYLVLVSHGGLAEGVQSSLKMFAGDKTDQIIAVGLKEGKPRDGIAKNHPFFDSNKRTALQASAVRRTFPPGLPSAPSGTGAC